MNEEAIAEEPADALGQDEQAASGAAPGAAPPAAGDREGAAWLAEVDEALGAGGPFAEHLSGFAPREEQQHLATAVARALAGGTTLVGEAGTGTGKTFAYLVPAVLSGQRVVVSTGTRHLQDQLFRSDLPLVRRALGGGLSTSLLKGRSNYLCKHRLARAHGHAVLNDRTSRQHLRIVADWASRTKSGDIAEVTSVPEDSPVWAFVVSSEEFCAQHEFEELADCFVHHARRRAQEADIVVVNHHLLCADLALKEEGFGEILPSANAFVIDEAHQLPDIAAQFFGRTLSSRQLLDLARDTVTEQLIEAPDTKALRDLAQALETAVRHFRLAFPVEPMRDAWLAVRGRDDMQRELERLGGTLDALVATLEEAASRGKGIEGCHKRALAHQASLARFVRDATSPDADVGAAASGTSARDADRRHADTGANADADADAAGGGAAARDDDYIHWFETFRTGFTLNMTPMTVAGPFGRAMASMKASWVFTSATLAVGGDFSHFRHQLGLEDSEELQVDSPFDYRHNALLYLPSGLPEPQAPDYTPALIERMLPVLAASEGRAFLLFTSYRALHEAERRLAGRLPYPLLVQGQMPRGELIDAFRSYGNAVLLGTSSFWEGVDVRGEALSCVVIDKLPFGSPGDPVMSARIDHMKRAGGNPFFEFQIPQAAIALKQGVGRLIRDVTDRGVLVLCDPRVRSRPYGEVFITSLPPMPITRDVDEVEAFFARDLAADVPSPVTDSLPRSETASES